MTEHKTESADMTPEDRESLLLNTIGGHYIALNGSVDAAREALREYVAAHRCRCCQGRCTCGGKQVFPPGGQS